MKVEALGSVEKRVLLNLSTKLAMASCTRWSATAARKRVWYRLGLGTYRPGRTLYRRRP
jgi:hypothetical protein